MKGNEIMLKINESGVCPKCKSENLEYGNSEIDGDCIFYEFECRDCGCCATECYDLVFVETVSDED